MCSDRTVFYPPLTRLKNSKMILPSPIILFQRAFRRTHCCLLAIIIRSISTISTISSILIRIAVGSGLSVRYAEHCGCQQNKDCRHLEEHHFGDLKLTSDSQKQSKIQSNKLIEIEVKHSIYLKTLNINNR